VLPLLAPAGLSVQLAEELAHALTNRAVSRDFSARVIAARIGDSQLRKSHSWLSGK